MLSFSYRVGLSALLFLLNASTLLYNASAQSRVIWEEKHKDTTGFIIQEGLVSQHKQRIVYKRDGKKRAVVVLDEPIVVSQAEKEYEWGYYQFPSICRTTEGYIIVRWQMKEDSYKAYGKDGIGKSKMVSRSGGKKWEEYDINYNYGYYSYALKKRNGDIIDIINRPQQKVDELIIRLKPEALIDNYGLNYEFYRIKDLPKELRGPSVYYLKANCDVGEMFNSMITDSLGYRCANNGIMSPSWWGRTLELDDNMLLSCTYNVYYPDSNGKILPSGVTFYESTDNGRTWFFRSTIPYQPDEVTDSLWSQRNVVGFSEPTISRVNKDLIICIMRSTEQNMITPLYKSFSTDGGKTWSTPEAFTPNGVCPQLLKLGNGVLVMTSGRPGIQLRFSLDGEGHVWSDPIDMMPFMKEDGNYEKDVTCGYTSLLPINKNTFLLVYSDFLRKNDLGDIRKTILLRKIRIIKK